MNDPELTLPFFDDHLHLPSPDQDGLDRLRAHAEAHPEMIGANLILNTREELGFVDTHLDALPPALQPVPFYPIDDDLPDWARRSGWYKIHPVLARLTADRIPPLGERLLTHDPPVAGLIVHCYPWGTSLDYEISLPLIIALARALPETPIIATHAGGYQSWAFRAHTASLPNVLYDFAVTMSYYKDSDALKPFTVYLQTRPRRLLFGSDWPSADPRPQLAESVRLARAVGVAPGALAAILLDNAARLWPGFVRPRAVPHMFNA
ncbi:MAG: amidohydrolase family protein [Planctomycetota bacterium]|nr:amidohydrolase family protein [Planctomycetota bacterium]